MLPLALGCTASGDDGVDAPPTLVPTTDESEMTSGGSTSGPPPMVNTPPGIDLGAEDVAPEPGPGPSLVFSQPECEGGATTTITGTVYAPSGELPLYNATVYVPRYELEPMPQGASCSCEFSGDPIVTAITDSSGRFVLENAPVGENIPLVVQIGKWRRKFELGAISACGENPVPDGTLRLPRNQSEGDLPRIAVSTGFPDALECLVRKLGVDDSEFTNPDFGGRVNIVRGMSGTERYTDELGGLYLWNSQDIWSDIDRLKQYDVVLLSCEGSEDYVGNKSDAAFQAMYDYANLGGRIFASHYHNVWFKRGPEPFPDLASFLPRGPDDTLGDITAQVITSFPKGQALSEWLVTVDASPAPGQVPIESAQHTIGPENTDYAQRWIAAGEGSGAAVQYLSANTPFGAADEAQCGRVVLSDIHIAGNVVIDPVTRRPLTDVSVEDYPFPEGCVTTGLSPQEKVLAFMLFDISNCVIPDDVAPQAPGIR